MRFFWGRSASDVGATSTSRLLNEILLELRLNRPAPTQKKGFVSRDAIIGLIGIIVGFFLNAGYDYSKQRIEEKVKLHASANILSSELDGNVFIASQQAIYLKNDLVSLQSNLHMTMAMISLDISACSIAEIRQSLENYSEQIALEESAYCSSLAEANNQIRYINNYRMTMQALGNYNEALKQLDGVLQSVIPLDVNLMKDLKSKIDPLK